MSQCKLCGFESSHSIACPMAPPPAADRQDASSLNQQTIDELRSQNAALRERNAELQQCDDELTDSLNRTLEYARKLAGRRDVHSVEEVLDEFKQKADRALSELAESKKDKERLDWFEENVCDVADVCGDPDAETPLFIVTLLTHDSHTPYRGETLRAAIDAARAAIPDTPEAPK